MTDTPTHQRRRGIPLGVLAAVAVAAITLILIAATALTTPTHEATGPVDLRGNHVRLDGPTIPDTHATPSGIGRFEAPSVGLNVPLGALNAVHGVIEPPGFTSAYWVRNLGVPPANAGSGTVFVAMHSLRNGGIGPGNALIDVEHQNSKIRTGATIRVDDVTYTVTGTEAIGKTLIDQDSTVWANTPNRLVVITCLQREQGGPSLQNMVIEATRAAQPATVDGHS